MVSTISAGNELVVASNEKPEIYNFEADGWRTAKAYVPPSSIGHPVSLFEYHSQFFLFLTALLLLIPCPVML